VRHRADNASTLLIRNPLICGSGGVFVPFLAINFIDFALVQFIPGI
jgi:potassium-transporting ATPase ATP-binding subunit